MKDALVSGMLSRCRRNSTALLLLPILIACGCQRAPKIDFATAPVASMSVALTNATAVGPGEKKSLAVTIVAPDGTTWSTNGSGAHKVPWNVFALTSDVVDVDAKGKVSLIRDPRQIHGDFGHVTVTMPSHPELKAEADIPLRFNLSYRLDFSGSKGMDGMDGTNGTDGMSGTDGTVNADGTLGAGGNGSDGTNGTDGMNGGSGGNAPDVQVYLAPMPGNSRLIEASVSPGGMNPTYFLIDPQGGKLYVSADGGEGGRGGKGGRGGRGGSGGNGIPPGLSGHDGLDGQDGMSGSNGMGGRITVVYDPAVSPFLKQMLALSSMYGPSPEYVERPLQPLW